MLSLQISFTRTAPVAALLFSLAIPPIVAANDEPLPGLEAYVVSHTHSDFAWADSLAGCLDKNVAAVAKSVELAEKYPDFRFCMEHMLPVREYLRRNPDKVEALRRLMREGRFEAGGFYTGPWELTSGPEALVRQLYYGKLWVKNTLGVDPVTVWNVDVAGHVAQLPQILQKAGIKGLIISAGSQGPFLYRWSSREGSSVMTWNTPGGYFAGLDLGLRKNDLNTMSAKMPKFVSEVSANISQYHLPKIIFIADGFDITAPSEQVMANILSWNAQKRYPPLKYSSATEAFTAAEKMPLPRAVGEMPSPWDSVQSQGYECFLADRQLDGQVAAAEKFASFHSVIDGAAAYPTNRLDEVWQTRLYVYDHNWGGTHGEENDRLKEEKIRQAAHLTEQVLQPALEGIAKAIRFKSPTAGAIPIVVFNALSWDRTDLVTCEVTAAAGSDAHLTLQDSHGHFVPCQLVGVRQNNSTARVMFCANAPSLGYATYYATWKRKSPRSAEVFHIQPEQHTFANSFYQLKFDPASGGIRSILDLRNGRELVRQRDKFALNELLVLEDDDEDIGLHLTGKQWLGREHPSSIKVVENGPVRLVIEVDGKLLDASARRQQIILYHALPRIDFRTVLDWQGKSNVQVYAEFPLNVPDPTVRYATPFGWEQYGSEMKYAAPWFSHDIKPVSEHRWRGVRGWVEFANHEDRVAVASQCNYAAFRDVSANPEPGFLLQPLLLRTIRSCGGTHFHYTQPGEHEFHFALESQGDSARLGEEMDSPLMAVTPPASSAGELPDRLSFLTVSNPNVHVNTVKQAEAGHGLVLRLVEMKEREKTTQARVNFFRRVKSAESTTIIEENPRPIELKNGAVPITFAPAAIETLRVSW